MIDPRPVATKHAAAHAAAVSMSARYGECFGPPPHGVAEVAQAIVDSEDFAKVLVWARYTRAAMLAEDFTPRDNLDTSAKAISAILSYLATT